MRTDRIPATLSRLGSLPCMLPATVRLLVANGNHYLGLLRLLRLTQAPRVPRAPQAPRAHTGSGILVSSGSLTTATTKNCAKHSAPTTSNFLNSTKSPKNSTANAILFLFTRPQECVTTDEDGHAYTCWFPEQPPTAFLVELQVFVPVS